MARHRKIKYITDAFNKEEIAEAIAPLEISQTENTVETSYGSSNKRVVPVSDRYKMVDFRKMVTDMMVTIENVFTPVKHRVDIYRARQELILQGESIAINGDVYNKVVYLLNSTDKTKALQMNIGFIREKNHSGVIVNVNSTHKVHLSARHFKGLSLQEKVASFMENLAHCDELFDKQAEKIIELNYSKVKLCDIAEVLQAEKYPIKFDCLKHMLINSKTDRINGLTSEQYTALSTPYNVMDKSVLQMEVNGYKAFQCYAEIWRSYDSHVINRETSKMMDCILGKDETEALMIPTEEEYNKAKEIVSAYESEQKRLLDIRLEAFKVDLTEYFKTNKLDGHTPVDSFEIQRCWNGHAEMFDIYTEPFLDECYGGGNDDDIEELAKKHGVKASFYSGMYGK